MWRYGWLILLFIIGCQVKYPTNLNLHAEITLDYQFSAQERELIISALNEWQSETYHIFNWSFKNSDKCMFRIHFEKRSIKEEIIQDKLRYYGNSLRGFSNKHSDSCEPGSINLIADNMENQDQYYIVILHEIGHQLNLKHSNHPLSIMNSGTAGSLKGLQAEDIKQFLKVN